jgi:hypothetical protein
MYNDSLNGRQQKEKTGRCHPNIVDFIVEGCSRFLAFVPINLLSGSIGDFSEGTCWLLPWRTHPTYSRQHFGTSGECGTWRVGKHDVRKVTIHHVLFLSPFYDPATVSTDYSDCRDESSNLCDLRRLRIIEGGERLLMNEPPRKLKCHRGF